MSSVLIMLSDNNSNPIAASPIINQINVANEESNNVEEQGSLLSNFPVPPKTTFPSKIAMTTSTSNVSNKDDYFDVSIRVGIQPDMKKFRANSKLISSRCNYFRTALSSNWARKEGDTFIIEKPNIKPKVFEIVLRYICSGIIDWKALEGEDFLGIWLASDEFMLDELEKQVREKFETKSEMLKKDFVSIVKLVYQDEALERFRPNCVDIINTTSWFQDSCNFETLDESIFQSLLSEEENFVHDGVIWNLLISWASASMRSSSRKQNLNPNKVAEWTSKEFTLIKNKIDHYIPLIRFSLISRNDYYNHVLPYRYILPADTTNNATLQYYLYCLDGSGNPKPDVWRPHVILDDSKIVNHTHVAMIGRWIDTGREKETSITDSSSIISADDNSSLNEDQEIPPFNTTTTPEATRNPTSRNEEKGPPKLSWKPPSSLRKLWPLRKNRRPVYPNDSSTTTTQKENNGEKSLSSSSLTHVDAKNTSSLKIPNAKNSSASSTIYYSSPQAFNYNFKLIYRGSRDGFGIESYNENCSEKGATVVVATMSHSRIILGGYYPVSTKSKYPYEVSVCSPDAFIFSFGEGDNPEEDAILSRVLKQHSQHAIYRTVQGPGFGKYDLGIRLAHNNNPKKIVCHQAYYEKKIVEPTEFTFDDIEVFQIIKEAI